MTKPATALAIVTQPWAWAASGVAFAQQPAVRLRDASNHDVNQAGVVVTVAIASGGGTLGGATTATTDTSGVAAFSDLSISGADGARTLGFTSGSLAGATSNTISVTTPTGIPLMTIDWGSYASTAALAADCTTFDCSNDHFGGGDVVIDPTVTSSNGSQTLRYHYNHGPGTGCTSITLGRDFRFPNSQTLQEAWAEFQIKYSMNFTRRVGRFRRTRVTRTITS